MGTPSQGLEKRVDLTVLHVCPGPDPGRIQSRPGLAGVPGCRFQPGQPTPLFPVISFSVPDGSLPRFRSLCIPPLGLQGSAQEVMLDSIRRILGESQT